MTDETVTCGPCHAKMVTLIMTSKKEAPTTFLFVSGCFKLMSAKNAIRPLPLFLIILSNLYYSAFCHTSVSGKICSFCFLVIFLTEELTSKWTFQFNTNILAVAASFFTKTIKNTFYPLIRLAPVFLSTLHFSTAFTTKCWVWNWGGRVRTQAWKWGCKKGEIYSRLLNARVLTLMIMHVVKKSVVSIIRALASRIAKSGHEKQQ